MNELTFSFTDCTPELQGPQLMVVSDLSDWSDQSDLSDKAGAGYTVIAGAARDFRGWITVTAEGFRRAVVLSICARSRNIVRMTGVQILRRSAILRI